jgi:hypothetical protein
MPGERTGELVIADQSRAALARHTAGQTEEKTIIRQPASRSPVELRTLTEMRIVTANIARSVERSFRDVREP